MSATHSNCPVIFYSFSFSKLIRFDEFKRKGREIVLRMGNIGQSLCEIRPSVHSNRALTERSRAEHSFIILEVMHPTDAVLSVCR